MISNPVHTSDDPCTESQAREMRAALLAQFNSLGRRFRQYETQEEWVRLVLEGAGAFAHQLALFALENSVAHLRGQVNLELADGLAFPIAEAAAFQSVYISKDPMTALRHPAEVTEALSAGGIAKAYLLPILNGTRAAAILFAAGNGQDLYLNPDLNGLEFVSGLASGVLERPSNAGLHAQITMLPAVEPLATVTQKPFADTIKRPPLVTFIESEQLLHIRARRFSRVAVAELQLARPDACRAGREQGGLYFLLAKEIDRSREIYRRHFMTISSMADYLHMELVQTAAEGDVSKLGADYPGPLR
jgi:hypothetical protein